MLLYLQARGPDFDDTRQGLQSAQMVNLNKLTSSSQLLPHLGAYRSERVRTAAAQAIWNYVDAHRPVEGLGLVELRTTLSPGRRVTPRLDPTMPV